MTDFEDPETEARWVQAQRDLVIQYLESQGARTGEVGEWPGWHVAPMVAIWAVESLARPGWIGWWCISGDLPTDYLSSSEIEAPQHPRKALRQFVARWQSLVAAWDRGEDGEGYSIGRPEERPEDRDKLTESLRRRADLLSDWCQDDAIWEDLD